MNSEMRSNVMPLGRVLRIVEMKLTVPRIDASARYNVRIAKWTDGRAFLANL